MLPQVPSSYLGFLCRLFWLLGKSWTIEIQINSLQANNLARAPCSADNMPCAATRCFWYRPECTKRLYKSKYKIFQRPEILVMSIAAKCFMTQRNESLHTESARPAAITAVGIMFYSNFLGIQIWNRSHGWPDKIDLDFCPFDLSLVVLWLCSCWWPRPRFNDCTALNWPTF